jgi:GDP-4-dehydro-6-deoxy-D-mannose reductase
VQKILITGITGFVASYFLSFLNESQENIKVIGIGRDKDFDSTAFKHIGFEYEQADLNNRLRVQDVLANHRPNYVLHLASDSSVSYSWRYPIDGFQNNTNIFLNLIESIRI